MNTAKMLILEIVEAQGTITDNDLIGELKKKNVEINEEVLNKILLHLEIQGLIFVRWMGKDKKRIEIANLQTRQPQNR